MSEEINKSVEQLVEEVTDPELQEKEVLELKLRRLRQERLETDRNYRSLQDKYNELLTQFGLFEEIGLPSVAPIKKKKPSGETEATAVIVLSDWHFEEEVKPETVNGLNEYNLDIAQQRAERCFQAGLRLTEIIARDVKVTTILMPLLGDFITNDIIEEHKYTNNLLPMEAISTVQDVLASGIKFLLKHSTYDLIIPCHSGNHPRTTQTIHYGSEHGHSLEYFMYKNLEKLFSEEKRVKFNVARSYHSYQQVYDITLRFHHGHGIRYQGGVGGIYIPANKAIAQWNKGRHADLDIFAHYHQMKNGGNFITNGSLIGYNGFAINIKADYEEPKQVFLVIDSKRGLTWSCPIFVQRQ